MYTVTWLFSLVLFVCLLGMVSFEIETPEGNIKFSGWFGKINDS